MTNQEEELVNSYKKDFKEKTGNRLIINVIKDDFKDYTAIKQFTTKYNLEYNLNFKQSPTKGKRQGTNNKASIYRHILKYILYHKYNLKGKEIGYYTDSNRTTLYNSLEKVENYIKTRDLLFIEAIENISEKEFGHNITCILTKI